MYTDVVSEEEVVQTMQPTCPGMFARYGLAPVRKFLDGAASYKASALSIDGVASEIETAETGHDL